MRRLASLAAVVLVAAACGSRHPAPASVPWVDRPLPLYEIPAAHLVRYPASAQPCRAGALRVRRGRSGAGLGNELEELVFVNAGATACVLRGSPRISAGGRTLHPLRGGTYFGQLVASDLAPGGHVYLDLATSDGCDNGRRRGVRLRQLVFTLPGGGRVAAPGVSIVRICGLSESAFGLPELYAEPRAAPGTAGTLLARVRLPAAVQAGRVLRFSVVLVNPTARAVSLRACPGYTEGFYAPGGVWRRSFELNCDAVRAISAHGRMRYSMRLPVPSGARPGPAKVAWNLDTATGPSTGAVVTVEPR